MKNRDNSFFVNLFFLMILAWCIPFPAHANYWGDIEMKVGETRRLRVSEATESILRMIGERNFESYEWYSEDWACVQVTGYEWWCCDIKALRPCENVKVTFKCKYRNLGGRTESMENWYYIIVEEPKAPTGISLPEYRSVVVGESITLTPTITPSDATKEVTWTSNRTSVASVSSSGVVTGKSSGTAMITATTSNGLSASCEVTVNPAPVYPTNITLSSSQIIEKGNSVTLKANITPSNATTSLTWRSSNTSIASISSSGSSCTVKGISTGTSTITATTSNGLSASCQVEVIPQYNNGDIFTEMTGGVEMKFQVISTTSKTCRVYGEYSESAIPITTKGSLTIPSTPKGYSVTSIGDFAFRGCSGLTSVSIPSSATSIGESAFEDCSGLKSASIPNAVTAIGDYAFYGCGSLTSLTIPDKVSSIGGSAFYRCSSLTSVTIGSSVTSIGGSAFRYCNNLTSVTLKSSTLVSASRTETSSMKTIFGEQVKTYIIGTTIENIGSYAFYGCSGLTSVTIPENIKTVGHSAFMECGDLTTVTLNSDAFVSASRNAETTMRTIFGNQVTEYVIGNNVKSIGSYTFYNCSGLTDINIPSTVTNIGSSAFEGCTGLAKIAMPNIATWCSISFENISANPLYYAHHVFGGGGTEITDLVIPENVTSIGRYSFAGCSAITSVSIPKEVSAIGDCAFFECNSLTTVKTERNRPVAITESTFSNRSNATLYVLAGCKETYQAANYWKDFKEIVEIIPPYQDGDTFLALTEEGVEMKFQVISKQDLTCSVYGTSSETAIATSTKGTISIPASANGFSVTVIDGSAFKGCSSLTSINIPNSVTTIGDYAFLQCGNLKTVTLGNGLTSIGDNAFAYCGSLTYITIPENVTSIGNSAFRNCNSLTSVTVKRSTPVEIEERTFSNRENATLFVPVGSKSAYESAEYWKEFKGIFERDIEWGKIIQFADANVKAICAKNWDINGDGELCMGEASLVTDLNQIFKSNKGITSFDELQYFTGLTEIGNSAFSGCSGLTSVTIPESVTSIGSSAFDGCSGLTSVTIPEGVTSIGSSAFHYCSGLTSITIPNSVTTIYEGAFNGCSGLTSVHIADLTAWCNISFSGDSSNPLYYAHHLYLNGKEIIDLVIPDDITSIGNYAFSGCSGLTSVTIPEGVTSIGRSAFYGCSGLTSVHITDLAAWCNISFGYEPFPLYYARHLYMNGEEIKDLVIPNSVTSIGSFAFETCTGLTSVTIPEGVTSIGNYAFSGCSGLTSVTIPNSVTSIGNYAFRNCRGLTSVTIPESVTSIGSSAFSDCSGLTSVTIPSSVTSIDEFAFSGCSGLTSITIPEGVTSIGLSAFSRCSGLTSITIPNSVTSIGSYAFRSCSGLTSVHITDLTVWCNTLFSDDSSNPLYYAHHLYLNDNEIIDLVIPDNITSIGSYAFLGCSSLTSVTIPNSVTSIGSSAFEYCSGLTSVRVAMKTPLEIDKTTFSNRKNAILFVPVGSKSAYESAEYWNEFQGITDGVLEWDKTIQFADAKIKEICAKSWDINGDEELCMDEISLVKSLGSKFKNNKEIKSFDELQYFTGLTEIGSSAFDGCSGLTSVTIPESVTSIGSSAFDGCSGLTSIVVKPGNTVYDSRNNCNAIVETATNSLIVGCKNTIIPEGVTRIGDRAFGGCSRLTSVTIPEGVTSIGSSAFEYCSGLTSVTIPNSVTSISSSAFYGCSSLTSVTIPNNVTSIGSSAFSGCRGLTSVTIPESVTSIGSSAFEYCSGLTSVTIPNSVTSIGSSAFRSCSGLTSVTIPNNVTSISSSAFEYCSGLTLVRVEMKTPLEIDETTFSNRKNIILVVPVGSKSAYESADYWNEFQGITDGVLEWDKTIQFADAKIKEICAKSWDINGDGELCMDEVSLVKSLDHIFSYEKGIKSFDELQYFTGLTEIGSSAFEDCSGLTSVTIPNSVTSIGNYAFRNCRGLTSVTIPESVTSIGSSAFSDCSGLTSVTIPSSVTSIDEFAFSGCSGLTSVTIPNSVNSIGNYAFSGCSSLTSIVVKPGNTVYDSRNNCNAIVETATNSLIVGCKNTIIPEGVTRIGDRAFGGCSRLTSVTIPESVTSIGSSAFQGCSGLTFIVVKPGNTVYDSRNNCNAIVETATNSLIVGCKNTIIPEGVTSIGSSAFEYCSGLTSVTIPNSVTSISSSAFYGCSSLTSITIPMSVKNIDKNAFANCSLVSVTMENRTPITITDYSFFNVWRITLLVPVGCKTAYETADYWNAFGEIIEGCYAEIAGIYYLLNYETKTAEVVSSPTGYVGDINIPSSVVYEDLAYNVTAIRNYAFEECNNLTSVTIPMGVSSIDNGAFANCNSMISVTLPESLITIHEEAFAGCVSLSSITIPKNVTSIGDWAFVACTGLTSIKVETGNAYYDSRDNCNAIIETSTNTLITGCKNTTIPDGITTIGDGAFCDLINLITITIPNSVTTIDEEAFGYSGLICAIIPNSVTKIVSEAFQGCEHLTELIIGTGVTSIGTRAFGYCSSLTNVYCYATEPPAAGDKYGWGNSFSFDLSHIEDSTTLHVPESSLESYKTTAPWSYFKEIVPITENDPNPNDNPDGIGGVKEVDDVIEVARYDLQGHRLTAPQRGINIIRMSDGTTRKVMVK